NLPASLLKRLASEETETAVVSLSRSLRQVLSGDWVTSDNAARDSENLALITLETAAPDATNDRFGSEARRASSSSKAQILRALLGRATGDEQDFLTRLLFGELRQGALEGVLLEAVARASGIPAPRVRRAAMMAGALAPVARAALVGGDEELTRFMVQLFQPVQPMLAQSASDVDAALAGLGEASFEYKLDGARVQVHKSGDEVRTFSRTLRDVTGAVPEIVEIVRTLPAGE